MKPPELVQVTQAELDALLASAKPTFAAEQYRLLEQVFSTFVYVMTALQNAKTSLKRFQRMLFGACTEHQHQVLPPAAGTESAPPRAGSRPARRGHGRRPAQAYRGAARVVSTTPDLQPGDRCPQCPTGRVYAAPPRLVVKVVGQAPLGATVYEVQQLRCRLCDAVFSAPVPAAAAGPKYAVSCASMIALLRYGHGLPHCRLEALQAALEVPLPDATQWDIVAQAAPAPRAVFDTLIVQAAQAPLLHHDDTSMKVLSLMAQRARVEAAGDQPKAKAINTSGIVAVLAEHPVALFFTGHHHAGQNLAQVLAHRAQGLAPPIQMCDALAANRAGEFTTILAHCLAHGRRQIVDVATQFPAAARTVLETLGQVYAHDATCRQERLTPAARLAFHQEHSRPLLATLEQWMNEQFATRQVEPNSGLGQALRYLLRHWPALTLFLRQAGAPLDNNVCEQALKRAILHRKGSLFYKTVRGAEVGDIYMSLIHTCRLGAVNAFAYLNALHSHPQAVLRQPDRWLPWNYHEQLASGP
jgi:hypothetical protein